MTRRGWVGLIVFGALVVSSCSGGGSDSSSSGSGSHASTTSTTAARNASSDALVGTSWNLATYELRGKLLLAAPEGPATLGFLSGGQLSGSTGCNSFGGTYTTSGNQLTITLGGMTLVACATGTLTTQESAITTQLPMVTGYRINGKNLTLTGAGNVSLFTYRAATNTLTGHTWNVTGVNNGRNAVESTALTEKLTASFDTNQSFSGFGGCNQLGGPYKVSTNNGLTIGPLTATQKSCGDAIDQVETEYSAALSHVTNYEIKGSILTMRDTAGAIQVTAQQG